MEIIQSGQQGGEFSKFERAVDRMEGLQTVPAVAQRLLSLTSQPDSPIEEVARLIASDAALTARVLRVAASPLYGGQAPQSLKAALLRLGLNEVRNLALSASVMAKPPDAFHQSLWHYTLSNAVLAEAVAKRLGKRRFCEPFVCALLHELGTLVMAKIEGPPYYALVGEIGSPQQVSRERELYGFTHCDIGALAVQRWSLFAGIEEVIQFHHEPLAAELLDFPAPVLATVQLVALTSAVLRSPHEAFDSEQTAALLERLGTTQEVLREELEKTQGSMGQYLTALR